MSDIKIIPFNSFQENCVIVSTETGECAITDPGFYSTEERDRLYGYISSKGLEPAMILLTHGHFDHIGGVRECAEKYGIPVYMDPADKVILENNGWFCKNWGFPLPDMFQTTDIHDGDRLQLGNDTIEVISTPGHTPGGVCFLDRKNRYILTGDTLFAGAIGRTDNEWGDYDALITGILTKLMELDGDIDVFPGHGPTSNIAYERQNNPFLQPFNEPYPEEEKGEDSRA